MSNAVTDARAHFASKLAIEDPFSRLDQGPVGAKARWQFVAEHLTQSHVLDFGCGEGAQLKFLRRDFYSPKDYVGVDMFEERREPFLENCKKAGIRGQFVYTAQPGDLLSVYNLVEHFVPQVLVLSGVLGYQGFTDWQLIHHVCMSLPCTTILTVPTQPKFYEDHDLARFDEAEIKASCCRLSEVLYDGCMGVII